MSKDEEAIEEASLFVIVTVAAGLIPRKAISSSLSSTWIMAGLAARFRKEVGGDLGAFVGAGLRARLPFHRVLANMMERARVGGLRCVRI